MLSVRGAAPLRLKTSCRGRPFGRFVYHLRHLLGAGQLHYSEPGVSFSVAKLLVAMAFDIVRAVRGSILWPGHAGGVLLLGATLGTCALLVMPCP